MFACALLWLTFTPPLWTLAFMRFVKLWLVQFSQFTIFIQPTFRNPSKGITNSHTHTHTQAAMRAYVCLFIQFITTTYGSTNKYLFVFKNYKFFGFCGYDLCFYLYCFAIWNHRRHTNVLTRVDLHIQKRKWQHCVGVES